MSKQLTFYFIRHGRTQWNEQELLQGSGNSPLTEQGIAGAQKTGVALQQVEFTAGDLCKIPQNPLNSHQDI